MKRIVIDGRMVTRVPHGFARYVAAMAEGLRRVAGASGGLSYEPVFLVNEATRAEAFSSFSTVFMKSSFLSPLEWREIPKILRTQKADLYHSPTFASLPFCPCPWIVTVHDLNHLHFGGLKERLYYRWFLKKFAKGSRALLTVSEFSKQEISQWTGVPGERIDVVPNALEPALFNPPTVGAIERTLKKLGLEKGRYFFCLSNPKPHKNVATLVAAYRDIRAQKGEGWPLVLSLKGMYSGPGIIELGGLEDDETQALLYGAGVVAFPSLYEGFGLPPVEAASIGKPVLVSDIPPHREGLAVAGPNEVVWLPPKDVPAWSRSLERAETGGLKEISGETQAALRSRFDVLNLGHNMDRIYRRVLGVDSI